MKNKKYNINSILINFLLFTITLLILVCYGSIAPVWILAILALSFYLSQILLFLKFDKKSFLVCIPLSLYALLLGLLQNLFLIKISIISYSTSSLFPPLWVLLCYPFFALTLNSSFKFLNKNLLLTFFLSGIFANLTYFIITTQNTMVILNQDAYLIIFIVSGISLILLVLLNRKLNLLREKYTDTKEIKKLLTVFFDKRCSFCSHQMETLQNRNQTGEVCYACPSQDEDLKEITDAFTYKEAMETIHAIDEDNKVLTGTQTISALFARTDLPLIAIFLQAPGFSYLFTFGYALSAKLRKRF